MKFFHTKNQRKQKNQKGFFVAELIVAIFIFGIIMTISMGSLVTALDANKKTQSLKSILNNLNIVLDTMTKTIATGSRYYCGEIPSIPYEITEDCDAGSEMNFLINEDLDKNGELDDFVTYKLDQGDSGGFVERIINTGPGGDDPSDSPVRMTSPEVNITDLRFYVSGTARPNESGSGALQQAKVLIVIEGVIPGGPRDGDTRFMIQNTITQRVPDFELAQ